MKKHWARRGVIPLSIVALTAISPLRLRAEEQGATGKWVQTGETWIYLNEKGEKRTGWIEDKGQKYYIDPVKGTLATGWVQMEGKWYFLDTKEASLGKLAEGWQWIDGYCYYFAKDTGKMAENEKTPDGFFVSATGKWANEKGESVYKPELGVKSTVEKEKEAEKERKQDSVKTGTETGQDAAVKAVSSSGGGRGRSGDSGGGSGRSGGSGGSGGGSSRSGSSGGSGGGSSRSGSAGSSGGSGRSYKGWQNSYNPSTENPFATAEELYAFHEKNELERKEDIELRASEKKREEEEAAARSKEENKEKERIQKEKEKAEREALERKRAEEARKSYFIDEVRLTAADFSVKKVHVEKQTYSYGYKPYFEGSGIIDRENVPERVESTNGEKDYYASLSYYAVERDLLDYYLKGTAHLGIAPAEEEKSLKIFGRLHKLKNLLEEKDKGGESAFSLYQKAGRDRTASSSNMPLVEGSAESAISKESSERTVVASPSELGHSGTVASASVLPKEEKGESSGRVEEKDSKNIPTNYHSEALLEEESMGTGQFFSTEAKNKIDGNQPFILEHSGFYGGRNTVALVLGGEWTKAGKLTALYLTEPNDHLRAVKRYEVSEKGGKPVLIPGNHSSVYSEIKRMYSLKLYTEVISDYLLP